MLRRMAYVTAEARQELLDTVARATDEIGGALAALTEAYEQVDDRTGDRLEEELFKPVQRAYASARRTHESFAQRVELPTRTFTPPASHAPRAPQKAVEDAIEAVQEADEILIELQDSLAPVEVGDPELRAGLQDVRKLLIEADQRSVGFLRVLGR